LRLRHRTEIPISPTAPDTPSRPASWFPESNPVDQGTEFVSRDLDLWAYQRGVTLDFSRPGKPTDNAFIESFNGNFERNV
jgi:transposase InsO family protein